MCLPFPNSYFLKSLMCTIVTVCHSKLCRDFAKQGCLANPLVLIIQVTSDGFVPQMIEGPRTHHSKYRFLTLQLNIWCVICQGVYDYNSLIWFMLEYFLGLRFIFQGSEWCFWQWCWSHLKLLAIW